MKVATALLSLALASTGLSTAYAATETPEKKASNPQHERMRACNAEAKEKSLKGDGRKQFMSTCLKAKKQAPAAAKK